VWLIAGIAVSSLFSNNTLWRGFFVSHISGGDLSIFVGFIVTGVGYYLTVAKGFSARPSATTPTGTDAAITSGDD
jgi:hypothetical protein